MCRGFDPLFDPLGTKLDLLGCFFSSTNTKTIFWVQILAKFDLFGPKIPFFPRSFWVQFSVARGTPPAIFAPSTPPGPSPPRWPAKVEVSEQRAGGRLFCCCLVTPTGNAEVMEGRRRRQSRYLEKLSALSLDVGERVLSKCPWNGLASPQPEAVRSYLRPWPPPPPRPFLLKGRADLGPLGSLSCRRCPWSRESFLLEEEEAGLSLLNVWDLCCVPVRAL